MCVCGVRGTSSECNGLEQVKVQHFPNVHKANDVWNNTQSLMGQTAMKKMPSILKEI
jgi:hypothetical protein